MFSRYMALCLSCSCPNFLAQCLPAPVPCLEGEDLFSALAKEIFDFLQNSVRLARCAFLRRFAGGLVPRPPLSAFVKLRKTGISLTSGKTEAPADERTRREPVVPVRAPQEPGRIPPAATAVHTVHAALGPARID
jgi:hypothetical protein